jgi:glutaredoxin
MRAPALVSFAVLAAGLAACRKEAPGATPAEEAPAAEVEVTKGAGWLFTHATEDGAFVTTDDPAAVPEISRGFVRATNPSVKADQRRDVDLVHALDLGKLLSEGKARARLLPRAAFETRALALLPPGDSSLRAAGPPDGGAGLQGQADPVDDSARPGASNAGAAPAVILYGTAWCGACRSARTYFISKGIPFVDKDIEKDQAAARELADKAARLGVPADRVPILDVRGRLLVGFDPDRVERLLGETL